MVIVAASCVAMLSGRPAGAATAKWIRLLPPAVVGGRQWTLYDSNRNRALIVDANVIWAVSSDPVPRWSAIWTGVFDWSPGSDRAMFYDPARDRIWAFSTSFSGTSQTFPGELWMMDLGSAPLTWVQRTSSNEAPFATSFNFAFDRQRDRVLVMPGPCSDCPAAGLSILNLSGTPTWTTPTVAGRGPSPRVNSSTVYDPVRDRMLFYGGIDGGRAFPFPQIPPTIYDETWALSLTEPMQWSFLTPTTRVAFARWDAFGGYDAARQRMIVTGGFNDPNRYSPLPDTWALDLSLSAPADSAVWTPVADPQPPLRISPVAWMDSSQSRVLRYGGTSGGYSFTDPRLDMWSLALGAEPAWTPIWTDSLIPPERFGHVAFGDADGSRWFVGLGDQAQVFERSATFNAIPWKPLDPNGPDARFWAESARDDAGSRALVFGGGTSQDPTTLGSEFADLWAFDFAGTAWSLVPAVGAPPARAEPLTLFDAARRRLIVHGGRFSAPGKVRPRSDTWSYDVATNTWSPLAAGSFGGRWAETGIYDPVRDRLIAFGGTDTVSRWNDVHVLPLAGGTWTVLPTSGDAPFPYSTIRAGYDAARDRMIVITPGASTIDAFALTLDGNPTWSRVAVDGDAPAIRQDFAAAPDAAGETMLLSGGRGFWPTAPVDDSWVLAFDETTTPILVSLVKADASAGRVRIQWQTQELAGALLQVDRRGADETWQAIASVQPDALGYVTVEDTNVHPGAQYDYRLDVTIRGAERFVGATTILVPNANRLRLAGARPNPSTGDLFLALELADATPAILDVIDVGGRRVFERSVGVLGPGEHVLRIDRLAPGLYFARLRQAGRQVTAKLVVTR
jgi:hypothetical protein